MRGHEGMRVTMFERPRGARGILPLVAAMAAMGGVKALTGAVQANQRKKRNEGYIEDSYRLSKKRLTTQQGQVRQNTSESLIARGLGTSPIAAAMSQKPHTIGEQLQSDNEGQFALENTDLEQQRARALTENSAERTNAYVGAGVGAIQSAMSAYSAGQEMQPAAAAGAHGGIADADVSTGSSPIASAARTQWSDDPKTWFGGVTNDPLNTPGSSWYKGPIRNALSGETNASFNVG